MMQIVKKYLFLKSNLKPSKPETSSLGEVIAPTRSLTWVKVMIKQMEAKIAKITAVIDSLSA